MAQTILFIKKGSPVPPKEMVRESAEAHRSALGNRVKGRSKEPGSVWDDLGEWSETKCTRIVTDQRRRCSYKVPVEFPHIDDILLQENMNDVVREVFPRGCGRKVRKNSPFPSINGHFSSGRRLGGAATEILFNWRRCLLKHMGRDLMEMVYHPHIGCHAVYTDVDAASEDFAALLKDGIKKQRGFDTTASFVLEPLKVRAVTAGPVVPYWLLKPYQKTLWKAMKAHPTFRLTGEPASAESLNEIFNVEAGVMRESEGKTLESGDYATSTDSIRSCFSRGIWNTICEWCEFPRWVRRLGAKALVGHRIHYPTELDLDPVDQETGQLMGSIISFIVLCMANAGICLAGFRAEFEDAEKELRELPLLINGDDCVMLFTARQRSRWAQASAHIGMDLSVGKCYTAKDWCQINSTAFILTPRGFEVAPYINFGLLGREKVRGGDLRTFEDLSSLAKEFLKGHHPDSHDHLMSLFIKSHLESGLLSEIPSGMSWWLPKHLGGLGLPWTRSAPLDEQISAKQKMLATMIMKSFQPGNVHIRALPGKDIDFPNYIQKALHRDDKLMVSVPDRDLAEEEKMGDTRFSSIGSSLGSLSYASSLWESALELPVELTDVHREDFAPRAQKAEIQVGKRNLAMRKHWYKLWKACEKEEGFAPLPVLLSFEPCSPVLPGGLGSVLERIRAIPRRVSCRISAKYESECLGYSGLHMKAS